MVALRALTKSAARRLREWFYPRGVCCLGCGALRTDDEAGRLCRACREALERPLPARCPGCGAEGWVMLCPACAAKLPEAYLPSFAPWNYTGPARRLVRALKYDGVWEAAEPLAEGMARAFPPGAFDALVPVPLHAARLRERGFNQARALCEALSRRMGLPVLDALERPRYTRSQTKLGAPRRETNVRGAFVCRVPVRGLRLLLVDDVRTTGATAKSCADALLEAGAQSVALLTAAVASLSQHRADG